MLRRLFLTLLLSLLLPALARAQDNATLVADSVRIEADSRLVAEGHVEVFHAGRRMTAGRIIYDSSTDRISIEGPIRLDEGAGFVVLADSAELDPALSEGLLRSARLVLDQQLQIAAAEIQRIGGRYTRMTRAVASSCQVCADRPVPLWEIRARRVTHDLETRQIYFDGAQFRVAGVPVIYLPRLRMPDGTVDRAAGFLRPEVRITSQFGTGLKLPWFLPIGEDRDLTFTPYVARGTRTLETRFRRAFRTGTLTLTGALSQDDQRDGLRGYLAAEGSFALPDDFRLGLDLTHVTDKAYLIDYGISSEDRLANSVAIERVRRDEMISGDLIFYRSLREGAAAEQVPWVIGIAAWERRFGGPGTGRGGLRLEAAGIALDGAGATPGDGRDTLRLSGRFDWRQDAILHNGMVIAGLADLSVDAYAVSDDPAFADSTLRALPALGAELRWPLARREASGAVQVLEPVAQLLWVPDSLATAPNNDSTVLEFDEGNLLSFSRFPGSDRRELGARANLGLTWTRIDPAGWSTRLGAGRVLRAEDLGQFTTASGLAGLRSDWMLAAQLETPSGLVLTNRALLGEDFGIARDEMRVDWAGEGVDLSASYIWLGADPVENRPDDAAEFYLDGDFLIHGNWTGEVEARYDFSADRMSDAGLGLRYTNECVAVGVSLSRRFTSSASVEPSTDFALNVALNGFGTGNDGRRYRKSCGP